MVASAAGTPRKPLINSLRLTWLDCCQFRCIPHGVRPVQLIAYCSIADDDQLPAATHPTHDCVRVLPGKQADVGENKPLIAGKLLGSQVLLHEHFIRQAARPEQFTRART